MADIAARRSQNTRKDIKSILIASKHRISKYETFFTCQNRPWFGLLIFHFSIFLHGSPISREDCLTGGGGGQFKLYDTRTAELINDSNGNRHKRVISHFIISYVISEYCPLIGFPKNLGLQADFVESVFMSCGLSVLHLH